MVHRRAEISPSLCIPLERLHPQIQLVVQAVNHANIITYKQRLRKLELVLRRIFD